MKPQIGLIGLGPMGVGLAANLSEKGFEVVAWDRDIEPSSGAQWVDENGMRICADLNGLVAALTVPRCILLSIRSGDPVDQITLKLASILTPGDVVADCGNSYFRDTARREDQLWKSGISFLGVGVSGGPDGARRGPSIMVGGNREGWNSARHAFEAIAARADGGPCSGYLGPVGSGHFVKMVHNGIEYGIMHLLLEVYAVLRRLGGIDLGRIAEAFQRLNSGLTEGFLTAATATVLAARLPGDEQFLIDRIDGTAEQKGTGLWTVQTALELGVPVPTLSEAVMSRQLSLVLSCTTHEREGSLIFPSSQPVSVDGEGIVDDLQEALALAFVSAFAQGLSVLAAAEPVIGHALDIPEVLRIWRQGCILQGELVTRLGSASLGSGSAFSVLDSEGIASVVNKGIEPLRHLVARAAMAGIPCSGLASALTYVESTRGMALPTGLIQLQRDYFGQHGLRDKETGEPINAPWHGVSEET